MFGVHAGDYFMKLTVLAYLHNKDFDMVLPQVFPILDYRDISEFEMKM